MDHDGSRVIWFCLNCVEPAQEGGVPRVVELLMETAQEAKPTLLGSLRAKVETDAGEKAREQPVEA